MKKLDYIYIRKKHDPQLVILPGPSVSTLLQLYKSHFTENHVSPFHARCEESQRSCFLNFGDIDEPILGDDIN
jgi:hypothetical protein